MLDVRSGQLIKARVRRFPLLHHYGIALATEDGVFVLHNTPSRGTTIDHIEKWLSTRDLLTIANTPLMAWENERIIDRFHAGCRKNYNLFSYNCEHFVGCMLNGPQRSPQLQKASLALGVLAAWLWLRK